ncbi:2-dehydro-3-deoxygluconokinase [Tistlia consotensis]|uniref:2-dehydro-3-deoxygluconokinase n=1 Tax=Tistlia consotensis USBA 355 TaxID=560819 RepID=A0A1Y6C634_9PROT|nr:sugar kinase [Tistlia consotensis]SMF38820.1 2-dehydro-3-deoxygluconokinase [Tistlia consotensis USBA 355]SNR36817.1 2-dehydro-3-deoxygluconokinase [Tistlia consotensis]
MTFDLLCIGEPLGELNATRGGLQLGQGGDVSNVAIAAARQGLSCAMLTALGADSVGDSFRALWAGEGVDDSLVATDPEASTGLYLIDHGEDGHRFSYWRRGSAASRLGPAAAEAPAAAAALAGSAIVHASAISQAISTDACDLVFAALERARAAGALVSYDTNLRLKLWPLPRARAIVQATAALADVLLPGLDDAQLLTGLAEPDAIVDRYLELGAGTVALTLGKAGALVATAERRARVPAPVVEAVDATGAGDCFDGAFLAEYRRTGDAFAAGRYATVAAALSTRGYGAVPPIPRRDEVERHLAAAGGV